MDMKYDDDDDESEQSSQFDAVIGFDDNKKRIRIFNGHGQSSSCTSSSYTIDSDFSCCSTSNASSEVDIAKSQTEEGKSEEFGYLSQDGSTNILELGTSNTSTCDGDEWRQVKRENQVYYYNRRTRESVWELPDNARLVGTKPIRSTKAAMAIRAQAGKNQLKFQARSSIPNDGARSLFQQNSRRQDRDLLAADIENLSLSLSTIKRVDNEMSFDRPLLATSRLSRTSRDCEVNDSTNTSQNMHGNLSEISILSQGDTSINRQNDTYIDQWNEDRIGSIEDSNSISTKPQIRDHRSDEGMISDSELVFCIYCGRQSPVDELLPHLRQCSAFETMKIGKIHSKAEKAYRTAWGKENQPQRTTFSTPTKNIVDKTDHTEQSNKVTSNNAKRRPMSNRRDRSDNATSSFSSTGSSKVSSQSQLMSTCPFCSKLFSGKNLSGHLLSCKERKKIRERRESSRNTPKSEKKKKALLTAGGRQLPNFPTLERKRNNKML